MELTITALASRLTLTYSSEVLFTGYGHEYKIKFYDSVSSGISVIVNVGYKPWPYALRTGHKFLINNWPRRDSLASPSCLVM